MSHKLKPLFHQVIFITGATSGIGLATVKLAVKEGAKVFMVARNSDELQLIQDEMRSNGFETAYSVADVAEYDQIQAAADNCISTFGRIDTWINNAGITIYNKLLDTTEEEAKRLFDTNFWGTVNGCKVAVPIMREHGGVIINMGSTLAKSIDPLQGIYTASEHAMKGYTDALRQELKTDKIPIALTLLLPGSVDTPFLKHSRNAIGEVLLTPPVSTPEEVSQVMLRCAVKVTTETGVGFSSFLTPLTSRIFPHIRRGPRVNRQAGNLFVVPDKEGEVSGHLVDRKFPRDSSVLAGGLAVVGGVILLFKKMRIL